MESYLIKHYTARQLNPKCISYTMASYLQILDINKLIYNDNGNLISAQYYMLLLYYSDRNITEILIYYNNYLVYTV